MCTCPKPLDMACIPSSLWPAVSLEDLITDLLSNPVDVEDWVSCMVRVG